MTHFARFQIGRGVGAPIGNVGALLVIAALALAGCSNGENADSGQEPSTAPSTSINAEATLRSALEAMHGLDTFRVQWELDQSQGGFTADFHVDEAGRCDGQIDVGDARVRIITTADATYQKGNEDYWRQDAEDGDEDFVKAVTDKWAKFPRIPELAAVCDLDQMLDDVDSNLTVNPEVTETTIEGQSVLRLLSGAESGSILVEVDSPHRILSFSYGDAQIAFSDFDVPVEIHVPGPKEYVDPESLLGS